MASIERHLLKISNEESPLWVSSFLDMEVYRKQFPDESLQWFPPPMSNEIGIAATKTSGVVIMNPLLLVRSLMNTGKWKDLFPCIIVDAEGGQLAPQEIQPGTYSRQIEIRAEIHHLLSPLVAVREQMFTRTCYSMENQSWLMVDLPTRLMDISSNPRRQLPFIRSCLVSPTYISKGASNVTWIEMTQFFLDEVHPLYHHLCGQVFSSERWFRTLSRECRRRACTNHYLSPLFAVTSEQSAALEQLVTLAKEMSSRFYSGLSAATPRFTIQACALRKVSFAMDGPYWTATKTVMFKVPADCLFNVVRSLDSLGHTLLEIPSIDERNCVSLHLGTDGNRVVREICFDKSGSSMLVTSEDVITSVRALSIHSHEDTSFLTVTYVMPSASSSSHTQQNWMKEFSDKICHIIQDIEVKTLV